MKIVHFGVFSRIFAQNDIYDQNSTQTQTQTQIVYFNNQHFMYTIDHNITWEFIWSIVQEWLIFGDGDPFAFTSGDD